MALLVILARATGNIYNITRALFIAAVIMVLHNPYIVAFDPSFQLSFLATLGLIWLSPMIEKRFTLMPSTWGLREFATATIATQIFVLPLLLYQTGLLSMTAFPTNLLVLMFVPVTMLLGFVTGVVGFVSTLLSVPFAYVTYALLSYELAVVDLFASVPFSAITVAAFSIWWVVAAYALYALVLWKL
jgi:competence protein ComEC